MTNILPNAILRKKRFGGELNEAEIRAFVRGVTDGSWADYQTSALLMAICIHGMSDRETLALTLAMAKSGDTLDLKDIPGVKADKHSTGGVGDTTSLILVPLAAACGLKVAKMSGRGLGFTGGTLDKLESIPGMRVDLDVDEFKAIVRSVGCAIAGQTAELAPADKVLYALRDVTETVDCLPLVVSSILSKKLAAGCDVVVLDVKTGSGAIMDTPEKSRKLAEDMVRIGNLSGRRFSALITDMDQPLGMYIGNALEVEEAIDVLAGRTTGPLRDVALTLGAHMLKNAELAPTVEAGKAMLAEKIENGAGLAKFAEMIRAQGGDPARLRGHRPAPQGQPQDRHARPGRRLHRRHPHIARSATPPASSARGGCARRTPSTPPWASSCSAAWANTSAAATRCSPSTPTPIRTWPARSTYSARRSSSRLTP